MVDGVGAEDPGWRKPLRGFLPFIILPGLAARRLGKGEPSILALRAAFLAFVFALLAFVPVLVVLFPVTSGDPTDPAVYALAAVGPLGLLAIPWAHGRLLRACAPPRELAKTYGTGFFLSIAFVESAALLGFVASFLAEALWPYLVGMVVALFGLSRIAPTRGRLRRLDEALSRRGCRHSLREGVYAPTEGDDAG